MSLQVLLVEDSPTDALFAREALEGSALVARLHHVEDGVEALAFLRRQGPHAAAPRPDVVLLDLNLPRRSGREVLREMKADPDLRRIPVVVLTTSQATEDVDEAYALHANCYVTKPMEFTRFGEVVRSIEDFWFRTATLPGAEP